MSYLTGLLLLLLLACAVAIYRLRGDNDALFAALEDRDVDNHYLRERNRQLNGELLTMSRKHGMPPNTQTVGSAQPVTIPILPTEHPQKRKPKSIRAKRKP